MARGWATCVMGLVCACAVAAGSAAGPVHASRPVPLWRNAAPAGLSLRFSLRADWGVSNAASRTRGWRWEAFSPGRVAWFRIGTSTFPGDFGQFAEAFVRKVRTEAASAVAADPHGLFASTRVTVGGEPAVRITVRTRGVTASGEAEVTAVTYGLLHAAQVYVLEFDSPGPFLGRYLPTFAHAIGSLRFQNVA